VHGVQGFELKVELSVDFFETAGGKARGEISNFLKGKRKGKWHSFKKVEAFSC
jgi:hypothetical protein